MDNVNSQDLVVISVGRLQEIIGGVVDSKMEYWLQRKREEDLQEKHDKEVMLTIKEITKKYKISRSTVYNKTKSGVIPCSRMGSRILISKADIEKVIKGDGSSLS